MPITKTTVLAVIGVLLFVNVRAQKTEYIAIEEEFDKPCISWGFSIDNVVGFYNPTDASPDYYNSCLNAQNANMGCPSNWLGFQEAKNGNGYFGFYTLIDGVFDEFGNATFSNRSIREYLQFGLSEKLKANHVYYFSYYVSLADSAKMHAYYLCHNIGSYFSATKIDLSTPFEQGNPNANDTILPFTPQIENTKAKQALNSSTEWIKVEGYYTAQGGEQYIIIGNFRNFNDSEKEVNPLAPPPGAELWNSRYLSSYYYLDDVYLEELGPVGMVDEQGKIKNVYYNTSTNTLHVSERGTLVIYNMQGVKVKELLVVSGEVVSLKEDDLGGAGIYVWHFQTEKSLERGKFVR